MKPPICFNAADAEDLANVMNQALSELPPLSATRPAAATAAPAAVPDVVGAMLARHGGATAPQPPAAPVPTSSASKATSAVRGMLSRHR